MTALFILLASIAHASGTSVGNGRVNCREGAKDTLTEFAPGGESSYYVTYTCKSGQWINTAAAPANAFKAATCREGQEEVFPMGEGSNEPARVICRNGRFVPKFPGR